MSAAAAVSSAQDSDPLFSEDISCIKKDFAQESEGHKFAWLIDYVAQVDSFRLDALMVAEWRI